MDEISRASDALSSLLPEQGRQLTTRYGTVAAINADGTLRSSPTVARPL